MEVVRESDLFCSLSAPKAARQGAKDDSLAGTVGCMCCCVFQESSGPDGMAEKSSSPADYNLMSLRVLVRVLLTNPNLVT